MNRIGTMGVIASLSLAYGASTNCNELELYSGVLGQTVSMDESSRTWPEGPEFFTNWGVLDGMEPPYIRLSGQRDVVADWKGVFRFGPHVVNGGDLRLQVHAKQPVSLAISVLTPNGESTSITTHITALQTTHLAIPLVDLGIVESSEILGVVVNLIQVPQYQYTTVFFDNIHLTCATQGEDVPEIPMEHPAAVLAGSYLFIPVEPATAERGTSPTSFIPSYANVVKSEDELNYQRAVSHTKIVLSADEHSRIQSSLAEIPESPNASVSLWNNNLHELSKGRLQDSVIANPSDVAQLADVVSAEANHQLIPLLIADVDYEAMPCDVKMDSTHSESTPSCEGEPLVADRYSHVALPVSHVNGSKIALVYDPQFLITNRTETLPIIDLLLDGEWVSLDPQTVKVVEFPQAGVNQIRFKLMRGSQIAENIVLVEVK